MDKKKITNMEVKKKNRNDVFRYICSNGMVSNPDIAYGLKLSLPTATQITKELIERGLVEEMGEMESTGGRRAKALAVSGDAGKAFGMDITKNHISLVLTELTSKIIKYERIFLPYDKGEDYYREASQKTEWFLKNNGCSKERVLGIGISFPGIIDLDREMVADSFERLHEGEQEAMALWEQYASYLAIAVNNIHMVLDYDLVLGGYVGSCMGESIQKIRDKVLGRNTFAEDGSFIRTSRHKTGAAA